MIKSPVLMAALLILAPLTVGADEETAIAEEKKPSATLEPVWCTTSLEECLPTMREFFSKQGSSGMSLHFSHRTVGPRAIRSDGPVLAAFVTPGGAADKAGMRDGDQIVSIRGHELGEGQHARRVLDQLGREPRPAGMESSYVVLRGGKRIELLLRGEEPTPMDVNARLYAYIFDTFGVEEAEAFLSENPTAWSRGRDGHSH